MISEENDKSHDHTIISSFQEFEILTIKFFFPFTLGLTLYYILQKLNDNFMAKWQVCFYPLLLFAIVEFLQSFYRIIKSEFSSDEDSSLVYNGNIINIKINVDNLDRIILISNFFKMILSSFSFFICFYLAEYLDFKKDKDLVYSLYMGIGFSITYMIYYILRQLNLFSIKRQNLNKSGESTKDADGNDIEVSNSFFTFFSTLTAPILTYFSNMMIVCSANTGVCTQIYASTIASLLGAFGVTISDFSEYLFPITVILLGVSLFSLYAKKKSLTHKPFLLGVFSCVLILVSHFNEENKLGYLIYPGNIFMIAAAIWNARLNKFFGLPKYNK